MGSSAVLAQAQQGDAAAIAHLMNEALQAKGIEVHCDRQGDCLHLWLISPSVPAPTPTVTYLRRGLDRLQVADIHSLQVYVYSPDASIPGWGAAVSLDSQEGEVQAFPIAAPSATTHESEDEANLASSAAEPEDEGAVPDGDQLPVADFDEASEFATIAPDPISAEPKTVGAAPQSDHPMGLQYAVLELEPGTPLKTVESKYFKLKALALKEGDRAKVEDLKQAFYTLKEYLERNPALTTAAPAATPAAELVADSLPDEENATILEHLDSLLRQQRISAQTTLRDGELQISWLAVRVSNAEDVAEQLHTFLRSQDPARLSQEGIRSLVVSSLTRDNTVVWQTSFSLDT